MRLKDKVAIVTGAAKAWEGIRHWDGQRGGQDHGCHS